MTLTIWSIPAAVTLAVLAWAFLMPLPKDNSPFAFNIGAMFSAVFRLLVVVFVTMGSWLIYFIWRAA